MQGVHVLIRLVLLQIHTCTALHCCSRTAVHPERFHEAVTSGRAQQSAFRETWRIMGEEVKFLESPCGSSCKSLNGSIISYTSSYHGGWDKSSARNISAGACESSCGASQVAAVRQWRVFQPCPWRSRD